MSELKNDPFGRAIQDFTHQIPVKPIVVASDICDDDTIPVPYLFRSYDEMPKLERVALSHCSGRILDIGAGTGIHAKYLMDAGKTVEAIDISQGCVEYMNSLGIPAKQVNFFDLEAGNYDTLLMLMNGIGIAGTLDRLDAFLLHAKKLVNPGGKIICDSTDIKYLYEDEDGSMWVDLSTAYYGNFRFQMHYKDHSTDWFDWLYVDYENLRQSAERTGWTIEQLFSDEDHYLAVLTTL